MTLRDGFSSSSSRLRSLSNWADSHSDIFIGALTFHHAEFDRTWALIADQDGVWMVGNQLLGARLLKGETVLDLLADAIRQDSDAA